MILIAEAGATSTRWRAIDAAGNVTKARSEGVNVATIERSTVENRIREAVAQLNPGGEKLERIHFYAAGMLSDEVSSLFPGVEIECASDLLAAARAVCGHAPGIAAILGTGSNSCFFDGEQVVKNVHSSGFILGDEGGGAALGRLFLSDFLKDLMPVDLAREFAAAFQVDYPTVVREVYKNPAPAAYLGSFAPWILERAAEPGYARDLVQSNFRAFCTRCLLQYDVTTYPVGIVGGFGKAAQDLFLPIAAEYGIRVSGFQDDIIDSLVKYHYER
jgi:N-acetylglucosamine kinase-like BadF-type ATPase